MTKPIHPITFIDKLIKKNERGDSFSLMDHQREILRLAFDFDQDGRLPWDTILYSCVKKSGKTTINARRPRRQSGFFRLTKEHQKRKIDVCVALSLRFWAR